MDTYRGTNRKFYLYLAYFLLNKKIKNLFYKDPVFNRNLKPIANLTIHSFTNDHRWCVTVRQFKKRQKAFDRWIVMWPTIFCFKQSLWVSSTAEGSNLLFPSILYCIESLQWIISCTIPDVQVNVVPTNIDCSRKILVLLFITIGEGLSSPMFFNNLRTGFFQTVNSTNNV